MVDYIAGKYLKAERQTIMPDTKNSRLESH
jgi:hypothetical protein